MTLRARQKSHPDDLPGIQDIVGIERPFDAAHDLDRLTMFGVEKVYFAVTDAMLAGAGPLHRQCTSDHSVVEAAGFGDFFRALRIDHKDQVKIPVADMARQGRRRSEEHTSELQSLAY